MSPPPPHPLLATLPPATDYLTYLTLLTYQLPRHPEYVTVLASVLEEEQLTANIGWDLVLVLLPLCRGAEAAQTESCLEAVARRGNPRECVIKVAEALVVLEFGEDGGEEEEKEERDEGGGGAGNVDGGGARDWISSATVEAMDSGVDDGVGAYTTPVNGAVSSKDSLPLQIRQFTILLSMLATLHGRIKTRYPSRFLSTTLQAVLPAYAQITTRAPAEVQVATMAVVALVRSLSELCDAKQRPPLPPRQSTSDVSTPAVSSAYAADPEAEVTATSVSEDDKKIQRRLLQAFVTHVLELYMTAQSRPLNDEDTPGLAWSGRMVERLYPAMRVPGRRRWSELYAAVPSLEVRQRVFSALVVLCRELKLCEDLIGLVEAACKIPKVDGTEVEDEDEPPSSPKDVDISQVGALFLLAEGIMSRVDSKPPSSAWQLPIFPQQARVIQTIIGTSAAGGKASTGSEPLAVLDAVVALGLTALNQNAIGEPLDDIEFLQYLQTTSLISANTPSPSLRFSAHMLTSTVLRSHPSDVLRLSFIRDTLEHCPYENLKVSAVGWIKGETLEAMPRTETPGDTKLETVFSTPVALQSCGPFLFPDLTMVLAAPNLSDKWFVFKMNLPFYLATLNFYYLLLTAKHLHGPLDVASLQGQHDIGGAMLGPLEDHASKFRESLNGGQLAEEEGEIGVQSSILDLDILEHVLERVQGGVVDMNQE